MSDPERLSTPSPPPSGPPADTGRHAAIPSVPEYPPFFESRVDRALRIALKTRDDFGKPPDASGFEGTGMWRYVARMNASVDKLVAWTEAADKSSQRRMSVGARVGWEVAKPLITAAVLAAIAWAGGFLHR